MSKLKLFLILASALLISCNPNPNDPNNGNDTGTGGGGTGTGGGNTVGGGYVLPKGSLSQEEQQKDLNPNNFTTTLFKKNDPQIGSKYFRIPALICTEQGTIIAAADRRYDKTLDLGRGSKIDVIVKRSTDLGKTWENYILVGPGAKETSGSDAYGDTFMINTHSGAIILGVVENPGIQGAANTILYKSTDDGKTWNKTHTLAANTFDGATKGFAASGQGVTLRYGQNANAKRLAFAYYAVGGNGSTTAGNANRILLMLSEDDGDNWKVAGGTTTSPLDETKVYELSDGTIMLNHRTSISHGKRKWSKSTDLGKNWVFSGKDDTEIQDPGCNADLTRYEFDGVPIKDAKYGLYINCNARATGGYFDTRKNHYVYLTKSDFKDGNIDSTGKYDYQHQLVNNGEQMYSGYPTITVLPDGTIATLTEETPDKPTGGLTDTYDIVFRRFNLYWLTGGKEYVDYSKDRRFQTPNKIK